MMQLRQQPVLEALEERCLFCYTLTNLGALPSPHDAESDGYALNANGQVAGRAWGPEGSHAVRWDQGELTDLHTDDALTYADSSTWAMNQDGDVVGNLTNPGSTPVAFVHRNGVTTSLGLYGGGDQTAATGINSSDVVAGSGDVDINSGSGVTIRRHALRWDHDGWTDIGTLAGPEGRSEARAINDAGWIVGGSSLCTECQGNLRHAFLWKPLDGMTDLDSAGDYYWSTAYAINSEGDTAGRLMETSTSYFRGFFRAHEGAFTVLNPLPRDTETKAFGMNHLDQVVGESRTSSSRRAVLWEANSPTPMSLQKHLCNPLPHTWALQSATGINDAGQIVGLMLSTTRPAYARGFLLTPSTAPSGNGHMVTVTLSVTAENYVKIPLSGPTAARAGIPSVASESGEDEVVSPSRQRKFNQPSREAADSPILFVGLLIDLTGLHAGY